MKNIQVIDGATNCAYDVFAATDEEFAMIFSGDTDVQFIVDFIGRVGEDVADKIMGPLWERVQDKKSISGIHGTLFYELDEKKRFYPNRRESDLDMRIQDLSPPND